MHCGIHKLQKTKEWVFVTQGSACLVVKQFCWNQSTSDEKPFFFFQDTLEQLALEEIDQSNAVLFIHYDPDTKMIYLAGKASFIHITVDDIIYSCTGITAGSACRESCVR